jgi:endonuclease/exonuclease/phosphatase family metal-dependent hydrolase
MGDLNDTPGSAPLAPLLSTPDLADALEALPPGADRWTYRAPKNQIDYLLLSKPLRQGLQAVGIERRGIHHPTGFGGKYPSFPEVTSDTDAASDHGAVWVDVEI